MAVFMVFASRGLRPWDANTIKTSIQPYNLHLYICSFCWNTFLVIFSLFFSWAEPIKFVSYTSKKISITSKLNHNIKSTMKDGVCCYCYCSSWCSVTTSNSSGRLSKLIARQFDHPRVQQEEQFDHPRVQSMSLPLPRQFQYVYSILSVMFLLCI